MCLRRDGRASGRRLLPGTTYQAARDLLGQPALNELVTAWERWVAPCMEAFGVEHCMFESNDPIEKMGTNLTVL